MSRQFDGVDDVLTIPHGTALNLDPWTVAFWAKRTGAGEGDARVLNKGSGTSVGAYTINADSGDPTRIRLRHQTTGGAHATVVSDAGSFPASSWVCRFCTMTTDGGGNNAHIYEYNGSVVSETAYFSTGGIGILAHNSNDLYIGNTSDGSSTFAGLIAFLAIDGTIWDNAKMLEFAEGALPTGTDFFWRLDESGSSIPNSGDVSGYVAAVTGAVLSTDNPPELYLGPTPEGPFALESGGPMLLESGGAYLLDP